ncbi:hypothetical protein B0H13DRAFT_2364620 [Mycena leptocephala]|nr:hypothetical protein B0H13DRAFT_2364620 [Mycena leptocephala]
MKFATAPIALVPLVAALPPAMRTVETNLKNATALVNPTPNIKGNVFVCVDPGFSGGCATSNGGNNQCVNFGATLNDRISSFRPDPEQDLLHFCVILNSGTVPSD